MLLLIAVRIFKLTCSRHQLKISIICFNLDFICTTHRPKFNMFGVVHRCICTDAVYTEHGTAAMTTIFPENKDFYVKLHGGDIYVRLCLSHSLMCKYNRMRRRDISKVAFKNALAKCVKSVIIH